jgi:hypothetical protein
MGAGRPGAPRGRRRRGRRRRMLLVGGLVAFGAYKMSKKDANRIEQHTGQKPEDMSDADLEKAMRDLHIEKQTRTAADKEIAGEPAAASPGTPTGEVDYLVQIEKLASLRDAGVLTEEEFSAKKSQLLGLN